ncbi:hypothetical protein PCIT_a3020 [Pseudoalteromonas citrea]|uniref:Uncharacterized protein n=1 Tax=Pseudoalteromonas citrea TaxID=43655 RepID=A0AAD4AI67_9GAMM|nr:hypothetical protein PCIT_a3020 [Pseudoalteromonas citrea]
MLAIFVIIRLHGFYSIAYLIGMIKNIDPETSLGSRSFYLKVYLLI